MNAKLKNDFDSFHKVWYICNNDTINFYQELLGNSVISFILILYIIVELRIKVMKSL